MIHYNNMNNNDNKQALDIKIIMYIMPYIYTTTLSLHYKHSMWRSNIIDRINSLV